MKSIKNQNKLLDRCSICGSLNTKELYPSETDSRKISFTYQFTPESRKTFRVVKCLSCSHIFCLPVPNDIYKNYQDVVDKEYLKHSETRKLSAMEVLKKIKKYKSFGKILDVGCAAGDFLLAAKNLGYDAEGLELSKWSAKIAEKKGLKIHRLTLKSLSNKFSNTYDVISLWGVIEHFQNPDEEMKYINRLLKPGGILVLWTGDADSMTSRILGRNWWYWQGQHIQYFTHSSLNKLANKHGIRHIRTFKYPLAVTLKQLDNSLNRYKFKNQIIKIIQPFFFLKPIWYLRIPGEMFWIGRKIK